MRGDGIAWLIILAVVLAIIYVVAIGYLILIAVAAIFLISWYLTHIGIHALDDLSDGQLLASHAPLALVMSGIFWAGVYYLLLPGNFWGWSYLAAVLNVGVEWMPALIGGLLGVNFGFWTVVSADSDEADPYTSDTPALLSVDTDGPISQQEWEYMEEGIPLGETWENYS